MPSSNEIFVCQKCGAQFSKWFGQCQECGAWGTLVKQSYQEHGSSLIQNKNFVQKFSEIKREDFSRLSTGISFFDEVLGGGIVPGSLVLLGGEPGIGKSTLVLEAAANLKKPVLYVSAEESAPQIKMRADRLEIDQSFLHFFTSQDVSEIIDTALKMKPALLVIDSIQTIGQSNMGSVNQVRLATTALLNFAKSTNIPVFIIGHITKEGAVAGPKTLEHLVDTVLYLEGDPYHYFRLLKVNKNRFGPTQEVGVFTLEKTGFKEVKDPSGVFLTEDKEKEPGSIVGAVLVGSRIFLTEIQALTNPTFYPYPQRKVKGIDLKRAELLIAVLSQRANIKLAHLDIYLNVIGGLFVKESAVDLPVSLAIAGAIKNKKSLPGLAVFGEVGLDGRLRSVNFTKERIKTAIKLGFKKIILAQGKERIKSSQAEIIPVKNLSEAIDKSFL